MVNGNVKLYVGDIPVDFYYLGEDQASLNPGAFSNIPTNGLLALFDATKTESYPGSGTQWFDLSPNKLVATIVSGSSFPTYDSGDKDFDFNGTDQAISAPISASVATGSIITDFTQIAWVKSDLVGTSTEAGIFNLQEWPFSTTTNEFDAISYDEVNDRYRMTSALAARNVNSSVTETVEEYVMIAATRTAGTNNYILYRNATSVGTATETPVTYQNSGTKNIAIVMGQRFYNTGVPEWGAFGWYDGKISTVLFYNRVLSQTELQRIYDLGRDGIII